jgi:chitinase
MVLGVSRYTFEKIVIVEEIEFAPMPVGNAVFVYTYNSAHGFNDRAKQTIDVVNHAFGFIKDGVLDKTSIKGREGLMPLRKAGVRLVLSVAGFSADYSTWSNAAATQAGREQLAKSIVETIVEYNYDGVDIDWEFPATTEKDNFTLLMAEIKMQLKAVDDDYLFTAAVGGGPWLSKRYNIDDLTPIFDYFLLMTYGMDSSTKSTHHVPLYYSQPNSLAAGCSIYDTVNFYIAEGGDAIREKLVVGAAFYGRKFINTSGIGQAGTRKSSPAYHLIKRDFIDKGFTEHWDDVAKVPYIHDVANRTVYTYENPKSIAEKSAYIKANNLGGMMIWQYGQDNSGTLIQAIYDTMK